MLTIVCGEDTTASREYFSSLKKKYQSAGYEIRILQDFDIGLLKAELYGSDSLFAEKKAVFSEYFVKSLKRKKDKALLSEIDAIVKDKSIEWIDWEEFTAREITNPKTAQIKEFKPSTSIFKLLDSCYPTNLRGFLTGLATVSRTQEEGFIYAMLVKHMRSLIVIKLGIASPAIQPWQRAKLGGIARLWPLEKLIGFYEGLCRIDLSMKTSANPYGIKKSLDILACYFL